MTHDIKCDLCNRHVSPGEVTETGAPLPWHYKLEELEEMPRDVKGGEQFLVHDTHSMGRPHFLNIEILEIEGILMANAHRFEPHHFIFHRVWRLVYPEPAQIIEDDRTVKQCDDCVPTYGASA